MGIGGSATNDAGMGMLQALGYRFTDAQTPGAGAAGGLRFGLIAFQNARLVSGIDMVLDAIGFDSIIKDADLIITGEGRIDSQTLTGKTPYGVLQRAKRQGLPVVAIGGSVQLDSEDAKRVGFAAVLQVTPPGMPLQDAMNPETAVENICRCFSVQLRAS